MKLQKLTITICSQLVFYALRSVEEIKQVLVPADFLFFLHDEFRVGFRQRVPKFTFCTIVALSPYFQSFYPKIVA